MSVYVGCDAGTLCHSVNIMVVVMCSGMVVSFDDGGGHMVAIIVVGSLHAIQTTVHEHNQQEVIFKCSGARALQGRAISQSAVSGGQCNNGEQCCSAIWGVTREGGEGAGFEVTWWTR